MNWPRVTMGDICRPKQWPALPKTRMTNSGYPVYGANGVIGFSDTFTHSEPTILVGCRGSIGTVHVTRDRAYATSNTMALDALREDIVDPRFLVHFLLWRGLRDVTSGTSQPQLTRQNLITVEVPAPSVDEQRRIAAMLDLADSICVKRRKALANLDSLLQAQLSTLLSVETALPRKLGEVAQFFAGGNLPSGGDYQGQQTGHLLMKVSDMNRLGNEREIRETALWSDSPGSRAATCPAGSVVFPKRGGAIGTNKKRITIRSTVLDPNLMAVVPGPDLNLTYLLTWFMRFDLTTISSGSSVPQLNKKDLSPLPIPVPPLGSQREFARVADRIEALASEQRAQLKAMEQSFCSIQSQAFAGRL